MTNQKVANLEDFSQEKLHKEVSKNYFWKHTHKVFRTLKEENIVNEDVYSLIEEKALNGKITENSLFKSLQKELDIQAADAHKIIDALKEKLMPASEDNTNEKELEERRKIIDAILASVHEEQQKAA